MSLKRSSANVVLVALAVFLCAAARGEEPGSLTERLKAAGIEPTRQGIEKILEPLRLTPERAKRIRGLLADLGSDDFETREKASDELVKVPHLPQAWLKDAGDRDLETRTRLERILRDPARGKAEEKVLLALEAVKENRVKGLAPLILEILPLWQEDQVIQAATGAVVASAERDDGKVLREALGRQKPRDTRVAALNALAAALGKEAHNDLEELIEDADVQVCLAASVALLNQENRKPLAALVRLLEAEQPQVRQTAATILGDVSGKKIDFAGYDEPQQRAKGVEAWRAWVKEDGERAKLILPVAQRQAWRGRIFVAVYGERLVREIDANTGATIFEAGGYQYPWGVHATAGARLAVDYSTSDLVEYDDRGKEVWRLNVGGRPLCVQRLDNGRTLVVLSGDGKVVEVDKTGKVAWEVKLDGLPSYAIRLPNGNTLVTQQSLGKILTLDKDGKVIAKIEGQGKPHTLQQLANGNILVCDFDRGVNEIDREGKVVWTLKEKLNNPAQAQRLPNGNTLVSSADGLMEYDPAGKLVHHFKLGRVRFCAY